MAEDKPKVGNIQLSGGKAQLITEDGPVTFDLSYVIKQINTALKNSRQGYYTNKVRSYVKILKQDGLDGIDIVLPRFKALSIGSDANKSFINQIHEWLEKLKMFRNIKTEVPKEEKSNDNNIECPAS